MQHPADSQRSLAEGVLGPLLGEGPDANDPFGIENLDDPAEMRITGRVERISLLRGQFVGGPIATARFHEDQGTVVGDEMLLEKGFGGSPMVGDRTPEPRAADLAPVAIKAIDGALRMLVEWSINALLDSQPIPHDAYFAKRNARLGHAIGTRVHSEEEDPLSSLPESPQVAAMPATGMSERVVDVADRRCETNRLDASGEHAGSVDESIGLAHGARSPLRAPGW